MGKALVEEGENSGDLIIAQLGTMIIFIGGICFDDEDVIRFGDLVSMYSAKKLIESMEENEDPILMDIRKKADEDTYENILEGVNDLINNTKSGKLNDDDEDEDDDDEDENDKLKK
jgi:hypothetical protein